MFSGSESLEKALLMVGELLHADGESASVVIIGGAALNLLGIVRRTTRDVDVVAMSSEPAGGQLFRPPQPFPEPLERAIATVARDLGLPANWLNGGPASQWDVGLMDGFGERLHWKSYASLHVGIADRYDLIHFKLEASADQPASDNNRHLDDLLMLHASDEELGAAAAWVKAKNAGPEYHAIVDKVCEHVVTHR